MQIDACFCVSRLLVFWLFSGYLQKPILQDVFRRLWHLLCETRDDDDDKDMYEAKEKNGGSSRSSEAKFSPAAGLLFDGRRMNRSFGDHDNPIAGQRKNTTTQSIRTKFPFIHEKKIMADLNFSRLAAFVFVVSQSVTHGRHSTWFMDWAVVQLFIYGIQRMVRATFNVFYFLRAPNIPTYVC